MTRISKLGDLLPPSVPLDESRYKTIGAYILIPWPTITTWTTPHDIFPNYFENQNSDKFEEVQGGFILSGRILGISNIQPAQAQWTQYGVCLNGVTIGIPYQLHPDSTGGNDRWIIDREFDIYRMASNTKIHWRWNGVAPGGLPTFYFTIVIKYIPKKHLLKRGKLLV